MRWQTSDKIKWKKGLYYITHLFDKPNLFFDVEEITITKSKKREVKGTIGTLLNDIKRFGVCIPIDSSMWNKFRFKAFTQKETEEWIEKQI